MKASIVVATKNRKEELAVALRSAFRQEPTPEVVVIDDGSTDGTAEMVRVNFPAAVLIRFDESRGVVVRRNEGARLATGDFIVSVDDDAEFSETDIVARTLLEFSRPEIGAVAIPFIDVNGDGRVRQWAPDTDATWITDTYIGTAHAVRRDLFLELGGYRGQLVHQGEERDFCIRLLAAGHVVRLGNADPIWHYESPKRDRGRVDFLSRRNDILFAWFNAPLAWLPAHLAMTSLKGMIAGVVSGYPLRHIQGTISGFASCWARRGERAPVPTSIYRLHRQLRKHGPLRLKDVEHLLPKIGNSAWSPGFDGAAPSDV